MERSARRPAGERLVSMCRPGVAQVCSHCIVDDDNEVESLQSLAVMMLRTPSRLFFIDPTGPPAGMRRPAHHYRKLPEAFACIREAM